MREIKFRAIKRNENYFVYGFLSYADTSLIIVEPIDIAPTYNEPGGDHITEWYQIDSETIGQYTGLKDKKGKEIYEGDIVKQAVDCNNDLHGAYSYHEVKFNNGGFLVSYLKSEKGFKLPRGYTAGFMTDIMERSAKIVLWSNEPLLVDEFEIIGNIYENPELLEVQKC